MKSFLLLAILSTAIGVSMSLSATTWYVDGAASSSGDGTSWETPLKTIQEAIDKALDGDTVTVAKGVYVENIHFDGKNIILTSTNPLDPSVVAETIIDGSQSGSVVTFSGTESEACILCGFTIRNGETSGYGGGICGGTDPTHTHASIRNNTITGNSALCGGGLESCAGTIQGNTVTGNSATGVGGGLSACHGTIQNNIIRGNSARMGGGGLYACQGTIHNNAITANRSDLHGAGLMGCGGTIRNNTIARNSAAGVGGGIGWCNGVIRNCTVWSNSAQNAPQLYESSMPTYSCIQNWTADPATGNISDDPRFAGPDTGDFRLLPSSPCIDGGYNDRGLPATDIAGMHRIMFGGKSLTVDMGVYEFHIWPPAMNTEAAEVTLKWSSLAGRIYTIYHSSDMLYWDVLAHEVPSAGDTVTTFVDSLGPVLPPGVRIRYYKVTEHP